MYKVLNETKKNLEENRAQVNTIEYKLTNLIETIKSIPTSDAKKIKSRNNMLEIVELILYFNSTKSTRTRTKNFNTKPIA